MRAAALLLPLLLTPALSGCLAGGGAASVGTTTASIEAAVRPVGGDGTYRALGWAALDPRAALSAAMERAHAYAAQRDLKAHPLRIVPGEGRDPYGQEVFTVELFFELEPLPAGPPPSAADSAFEWRMRRLVEDGTLPVEAYERLMAAQPGVSAGSASPPPPL